MNALLVAFLFGLNPAMNETLDVTTVIMAMLSGVKNAFAPWRRVKI